LTNAAGPAGQEVVQVYVRQKVGSRSRPVRQLHFFQKVEVAAGGETTVRFSIPVRSLGFHDDQARYRVEPGEYEIYVGSDSNATLGAVARITAQ
ncbi:MAG: bglX, partial [Xanthobacteraceae bacterium]